MYEYGEYESDPDERFTVLSPETGMPASVPVQAPMQFPRPVVTVPPSRPVEVAPAERPFDWERALMGFAQGAPGIAAVDARREKQFAQQDKQRKEAEERSRQMAMLKESTDPQSPTAKRMRDQVGTGMQIIGESMPQLKPFLDGLSKQMEGMGAADIMGMQQRLGSVFNLARQVSHDRMLEQQAATDRELKERQIAATLGKQENADALGWAKLKEDARQADQLLAEKKAAREAKEKAIEIRTQARTVDKQAVNELQNIDTMHGMLKEAGKAMEKAYTGPLAGMAVSIADVLSSVTGLSMPESLAATKTLQSNIENATADVRKSRFGASLTEGETKALNEWKPGIKLSKESNQNLISAMHKYMAYRAQQRVQQVYKETGLPIYIPKDQQLSLDDARELKALWEGIDQYDDESVIDVISIVSDIIKPYGGRVFSKRARKADQDAPQGEQAVPTKQEAAPASAPIQKVSPQPQPRGPYGMEVIQNGIRFRWNGFKYQEVK